MGLYGQNILNQKVSCKCIFNASLKSVFNAVSYLAVEVNTFLQVEFGIVAQSLNSP